MNISKYRIADQPARVLNSAAVYPNTAGLRKALTLTSRFDEKYTLFREDGKDLWVARNLALQSMVDDRVDGAAINFTSTFKPRSEEQARVVHEAKALLAGGYNFVVSAPTGFGKTVCAMPMIAAVGRLPMVIVPKEDLMNQWVAAAKMVLGLTDDEIGLIYGDKMAIEGKKFLIGMIHSLAKYEKYPTGYFDDVGFVIWDETHRVGAETFSQSPWLFRAKLRMGVSATPERRDGKSSLIEAHIGPVRVITEAIPMRPKVLVLRSKWKCPRRPHRRKDGSWTTIQIPHKPGKTMHINKILARDEKRNDKIARFVSAAYSKGRNTMVFADTKEHLENLKLAFIKAGVHPDAIGFYVGGLSDAQKEKAKAKPVILATYKYTSEGTDIPWLDVGVFATPRSDVIQIAGRILREYPDKPQPVLFDVMDADSEVFAAYYNRRLEWYKKIGAEVKTVS